jgi:hypothetical protein
MEQQEVALVEYKLARPYTIAYAVGKDCKQTNTVRLMPGMNVINAKEWAEVENHPVLLRDIDEGEVIVHEKKKGNVSTVLEKMKPREALAMVKATLDRNVLISWKATETRTRIVDELDKQIDKLTPKKAKKQEEDEE